MKIFLSWSGETSKRIAELLVEWLPLVVPPTRPWMSGHHIKPGKLWDLELTKSLRSTNCAILVLTRENQAAPWLLYEAGDQGRPLLTKLRAELADIGFAFALLTPDDVASAAAAPRTKRNRARQNVVFEHGMLVGMLGPERVCAVVKGDVEVPSDLAGILYKKVGVGEPLDSIGMALIKELKTAGYDVDANRLWPGRDHWSIGFKGS